VVVVVTSALTSLSIISTIVSLIRLSSPTIFQFNILFFLFISEEYYLEPRPESGEGVLGVIDIISLPDGKVDRKIGIVEPFKYFKYVIKKKIFIKVGPIQRMSFYL